MGIPRVKKFWSFCTLERHGWRKNFPAAEGGRQIFWVVPWEFDPQMIFFACPCMIPVNAKFDIINDDELTPEAGRNKGLQLVLDAHAEIVSGGTIQGDFDGFYVTVGPKDQYPLTMKKSILIRPGHNNFVSLEATKITSDDNLKKIDVDQRNCLFTNEMELYYHNDYSKANCDLEGSMLYALSQVSSKYE